MLSSVDTLASDEVHDVQVSGSASIPSSILIKIDPYPPGETPNPYELERRSEYVSGEGTHVSAHRLRLVDSYVSVSRLNTGLYAVSVRDDKRITFVELTPLALRRFAESLLTLPELQDA